MKAETTENVRLEFALGEITKLELLIGLNMIPQPEIDPKGLSGKEKWNAQGLEGKAFVLVPRAMANVLVHKMTRLRSRIVDKEKGT